MSREMSPEQVHFHGMKLDAFCILPERRIIVSHRSQVVEHRIAVLNSQCNVIVLSLYLLKETITQYLPFILTEICEHTLTITGPYLNQWSVIFLHNSAFPSH